MNQNRLPLWAVFLILFSTVIVGSIRPVDAVYVHYLGRETKNSWVPVFALYDPPGDKSYSRITETKTTTLTILLGGEFAGAGVDGGFSYETKILKGWETPDNEHSHGVIVYEYRMTWDVYCYITTHSVHYEAVLRNQELIPGSEGIKSFESARTNNILINDLTGTRGSYSLHKQTDKNYAGFMSIGYKSSVVTDTSLGFKIELQGIEFRAGVRITSGSSVYTEAYYYWKSTEKDLNFYIYSDSAEVDGNFDGKGIWFSE